MARPHREGLEYFPIDVDIDQDDKLVVPIAKHGMLGFGVIVKLMMEIYKNGYHYPWTEKELYVFSFKIGVESEKVNEIVTDCINYGFFCINQYKSNHILTSFGFQKRFLLATTRRKDATINSRFLVVKELMLTETELMLTETKEMSVESTQSKEKVKESKEKVNIKDKKTSSRKQKTYSEDDPFYKMAAYFHDRLLTFVNEIGKGHLIQNSNMQTWANDFRKIIEIDKRPRKELGQVVDWATLDPFWQQNILSPDKLRKKYIELCLQMSSKNGLRSNRNANDKLFEKNKIEAQKIMEAVRREGIRD